MRVCARAVSHSATEESVTFHITLKPGSTVPFPFDKGTQIGHMAPKLNADSESRAVQYIATITSCSTHTESNLHQGEEEEGEGRRRGDRTEPRLFGGKTPATSALNKR